MNSRNLRALPTLVALALIGCAYDRQPANNEIAEISARHDRELGEFTLAQSEFARRNPMPRYIDFGENGTIYVSECTLEGNPGREEFWLRYTWANTASHAIERAKITITLRDPHGGLARSEEVVLSLPFISSFTHGSSYTNFLHMSAHGMHLGTDLEWEIRAEALTRPPEK